MEKNNEKNSKRLPLFSGAIKQTLPYLEMKSNREITIDGCRGILQYEKEIIKISTGNMVLSFSGRNLNIKCLTSTSLVIDGYIMSVEFER